MAPTSLLLVYTKTYDESGWVLTNPPGVPISSSSPLIESSFDSLPADLIMRLSDDLNFRHKGQLVGHVGALAGFALYSGWKVGDSHFCIVLQRGDDADPSSTSLGEAQLTSSAKDLDLDNGPKPVNSEASDKDNSARDYKKNDWTSQHQTMDDYSTAGYHSCRRRRRHRSPSPHRSPSTKRSPSPHILAW